MIKSPEEAIARVLAGLQASEAPLGMERRILKAVQDRASAQSGLGWHWLRPIWLLTRVPPTVTRSLLFGLALAGTLTVVFAISSHYRDQRVRDAAAQLKMTPAAVTPPAAPSFAAASSPVSPPESAIQSPAKRQERNVGHLRHDDSLALSEMRAASHPAPPLPLTREEKLLLRVAHIGGPKEFAMLNPATRAKREEEADVEFQQFFGEETAKSTAQN